jgi:hemoglobin-like flavoprotein
VTARQRTIIRHTFAEIRDAAGPIALLFYGRLFDLDPSLRKLFPSDMKAQGEKLMAMFEHIVKGIDEPESYRDTLRELGAKHVTYGVKLADYDVLTRAFLWSLTQALETGFSSEPREAWATLLDEINTEMKIGAGQKTSAGHNPAV